MPETGHSEQAAIWLAALDAALTASDVPAAVALFEEEGCWRDLLTFTWNVKTMEGRSAITAMLEATLGHMKPRGFRLDGEASADGGTIEAWFTFETEVAHGQGILRLNDGKCRTLLTVMQDLKSFEEKKGPTRPQGLEHKADPARVTWSEAREKEGETLGREVQPYCLIIGGGQGGTALGARLRRLGVPAIIVEKNACAGDSMAQPLPDAGAS